MPCNVLGMKRRNPILIAIHQRAIAVGVPPTTLMRKAGMRPATWSDWQGGATPQPQSLAKLEAVLAELERVG
jgi:hypothetical protein